MTKIIQKEFWERSIHRYRRPASHPVVSMYSESKLNLIFKEIDLNEVKKVLDIGCGNGFFTIPLKRRFCNVVGLDFSYLMLSIIKKDIPFLVRADSHFLPFKDFHFDMVFSANLLHHLENVRASIKEMIRVSKKYIVIIEPNKQNLIMYLFSKWKKEENISTIFKLIDLKTIIKEENIKILDSFSTGFIGPNRTPPFLVPILRNFDKVKNRYGFYNVIIGIKN